MNNEIKKVSPFKNFCVSLGNLPTSYLESMSYYETLCWLIKYLQNTINPAINNNAEALKELQEYVENLDLTDEVNAKLDEMAESGELAEIINVQMIGSLANLTTTDKTSVVNAINEVNGVNQYLNISSFTNYNNVEINSGTLDTCSLTVARNSEGSLCKVYGKIKISGIDSYGSKVITLNQDTGLRPSTNINITGTSFAFGSAGITECYLTLKTDGSLQIQYYAASQIEEIILIACLIFVKNFGD